MYRNNVFPIRERRLDPLQLPDDMAAGDGDQSSEDDESKLENYVGLLSLSFLNESYFSQLEFFKNAGNFNLYMNRYKAKLHVS